ncbi:MAG: cytochrome c3 family protein [Bacteroidales bacterium]|nr:cytochrome c3 family protein [Bacteroidales bacterium]
MNPYYVIDTAAFYVGNHHLLSCTDCHDPGYENFPHANDLQMQEMLKCTDCHDGDEVAEKYNFKEINVEFKKSVHAQAYSKDFSCWMCHNPHSYAITARKNTDIKKVIVYDNEICLHCHSEVANLTPLSDHAKKNISTIHDWLPNQILHFKSVRCLDCHVKVENHSMVDHQILSKESAVKDCVECHSKNTRLMATLYKFRTKELRSKSGFLNAIIITNDSYVISANSNHFLNVTSLVIIGLIILVIIIHAILRITLK